MTRSCLEHTHHKTFTLLSEMHFPLWQEYSLHSVAGAGTVGPKQQRES